MARGQSQPRCPAELEPRVLQGGHQLFALLGPQSPHPQLTQVSDSSSQLCRFIGSLDNFRAVQSNTQKWTRCAPKLNFPPILVVTVWPESPVPRGGLGGYLLTLVSTQVTHSDSVQPFLDYLKAWQFSLSVCQGSLCRRKSSVTIPKHGSLGLCAKNPFLSPSHCWLCGKGLSRLDTLPKFKLGPLNFISNFLLC